MAWIRLIAWSLGSFLIYLLIWQVLIIITSRGVAHGAGYYRVYAPMFMVTGVLFFALGLFLRFR